MSSMADPCVRAYHNTQNKTSQYLGYTHTLSLTSADDGRAVLKLLCLWWSNCSYYGSVEATPIPRGQGLRHQHRQYQQHTP